MTLSIQQLWEKYSVNGSIPKENFEKLVKETSMRQNIRYTEELGKIIPEGANFMLNKKVTKIWDCIGGASQNAKEIEP